MSDEPNTNQQPTTDKELQFLLWWEILRPERLAIADEIQRMADRYRRAEADSEAHAVAEVARWLRASAGQIGNEPAHSIDDVRRVLNLLSGAAS